MMRICFDTETPTRYYPDGVPDVVCLTWAPENDKSNGRIVTRDGAIDLWDAWVSDPDVQLIAHNAPFDVCVMAKASALRAGTYTAPGFGPAFERVFRLYETGRIRDTIPDQRLIDVAQGRPGDDTRMGTLAKRLLHLDMGDDKRMPSEFAHLLGTPVQEWPTEARAATPWRYKYGLLQDVPLEHWPAEPRRYACEDPVVTWGIVDWQDKRARKVFGGPIVTSREQARAAFDLHLHSVTGFRTDRPRVRELIDLYAEVERVCSDLLVSHCALCGGQLVEMPAPADVKAAFAAGALPGDSALGDCPKCRERCALVREDIKWRARADGRPRLYKGQEMHETRKRVKDRKAAQRLVWATLGAAAPLTKTNRERGRPKSQETICADADTMIKVAAAMADGRDGLLGMPDVLAHAAAGDLHDQIAATSLPVVNAIRLYSRAQKYQTAFLAPLDTDRRVRTSYQVCKDTARTSARKPNTQNFPRGSGLSSELTIRSCILPDPGHVFLVCDYSQIELVGLAHVLNVLGRMRGRGDDYESSLSRAINAGMDGHIMVASHVLHLTYEETNAIYKRAKKKKAAGISLSDDERAVLKWRQVGKVQNYGAAGGMGAVTFVGHAAKQDAIISLAESHMVRDAWLAAWSPDMPDYFRYMSELTNRTGRADLVSLYSGFRRGKATFTQCCNHMFQNLCAMGAKAAMVLISDACFRLPENVKHASDGGVIVFEQTLKGNTTARLRVPEAIALGHISPLYGCRPVLFVHDEEVLSCPITHDVPAAAAELSRLMIAGMSQYINDVKIEADCDIMDRWGKG